jgi:hypothetical protein
MPKLYPQSMTAEVTAEVSDLGYKGQDFRLKKIGVKSTYCLTLTASEELDDPRFRMGVLTSTRVHSPGTDNTTLR